jgi:hypothetical protein
MVQYPEVLMKFAGRIILPGTLIGIAAPGHAYALCSTGIEVRAGPVQPLKPINLQEFVGNQGIAWKDGEVRSTIGSHASGPPI